MDTDPLDDMFGQKDSQGGGISSSSWDMFIRCIDSAANSLSMATGNRKSYPTPEQHHVVPHNNIKHTPEYEGIVVKYQFSLSSSDNIIPLKNHRGRHTEGYHDFIAVALHALDDYAQGNKTAFNDGFAYIVDYVSENSWLPYARKLE